MHRKLVLYYGVLHAFTESIYKNHSPSLSPITKPGRFGVITPLSLMNLPS